MRSAPPSAAEARASPIDALSLSEKRTQVALNLRLDWNRGKMAMGILPGGTRSRQAACSGVASCGKDPPLGVPGCAEPTGAWNAAMFGWPEPYPDGAEMADARNEVEAHANRLHAHDFHVLTDDERAEFRALSKGARDFAGTKMTDESSATPPRR